MSELKADVQVAILIGAIIESIKEDNPELHEKIGVKYEELINSLPNHNRGEKPWTMSDFVNRILSKVKG